MCICLVTVLSSITIPPNNQQTTLNFAYAATAEQFNVFIIQNESLMKTHRFINLA
jgi:hypothetical protein